MTEAGGDRTDVLEALRERPRFRGRLLGVLGGSTGLADHLAANPADWRLLLPEAPTDLIEADTIATTLATAVGVDPAAPRCTGTAGARATMTGAAGHFRAAPGVPIRAPDHRRP